MTADEIAAAVKAGHADVVDLWEAVQQFAAQRSSKWLKLGRGGVTFDDLQQEAFIAMLQALEGWDPDAGAFLTWYGIWIKKAFTVACSLRSAKGQRSPLEMAVSLDAPVSENPDGETLVDFLPDTAPSVEELVEAARDAIQWGTEHKEVLEAVGGAVVALTAGYIAMKTAMSAKSLFDDVTSSIKGIATAGGDAKTSVGNLAGAFEGLPGYAGIAVAAIGLIVTALEELKEAQEEALNKQLEYMDSFTTFADYQANGLVDASGRVNYAKAEQMQAAGTFKKADTTLGASAGRTFYENSWGNLVPTSGTTTSGQSWNLSTRAGKEAFVNIYGGSMTGSRHQAGEDFVMSDWTPAFLDYGERVLTRQENLAYTAMGGVDGMARMASAPASAQQQKVDFSVGFKVEPREAAHFLAPYIVEEFKRNGWK